VRAGELCVCPNTRARHQKEIKIILVRVKTDITKSGTPTTGVFRPDEVKQIFHTMHQALLRPDIADRDTEGHAFELDLSDVPEFHDHNLYASPMGGAPAGALSPPPGSTPGKFVYVLHAIPSVRRERHVFHNASNDLHRFLVKKFNEQRVANGWGVIKDCYLLFCFGVEAEFFGTADADTTEVSVNVPSGHPLRSKNRRVIVSKPRWRPSTVLARDRDDPTAAHEILHALTLRHTHRDWVTLPTGHTTEWTYLGATVISVGCKYLFPFETTSNIMSYCGSASTTWRWQWAIMQANTTIAPDDWTLGKEEKSV
jgi:hypothetical protein